MTWQQLRMLSAQAVDGGSAPVAGAFVAHANAAQYASDEGCVRYFEIGFDSVAVGGAPTSVTLGVWRTSGDANPASPSLGVKIDKLTTITLAASALSPVAPIFVEAIATGLALTVDSFVGGTSPNVSGAIRFRPVRR